MFVCLYVCMFLFLCLCLFYLFLFSFLLKLKIYRTHLEDKKGQEKIESAQANLATTYVNAFVNAGCAMDSLMISEK